MTTQEVAFKDTVGRSADAQYAGEQELAELHGDKMVLNMGPSHPSTHGVLRIILELDGEIITKATPDVGYLHRGDEKIAENMTYTQFIPYTDRLDYLAPLANNVAYALAVEKLLGIEKQLPLRCQYIRVICCELARISAHLLGLGSLAMDVGAITVPYADAETGRVVPIYLTRTEAARLRAEHEQRNADLTLFFRSLGVEPVQVGSHHPGDVLAAFLRWADLRVMARGALV